MQKTRSELHIASYLARVRVKWRVKSHSHTFKFCPWPFPCRSILNKLWLLCYHEKLSTSDEKNIVHVSALLRFHFGNGHLHNRIKFQRIFIALRAKGKMWLRAKVSTCLSFCTRKAWTIWNISPYTAMHKWRTFGAAKPLALVKRRPIWATTVNLAQLWILKSL